MANRITQGMSVLAYNLVTHTLEPTVITSVYVLNASDTYIFNGNLAVDGLEVMYINGQWTRAENAKVGDVLFDPINNSNVTINSIAISNKGGTVYDFIGTPVNDYIANGYLIDLGSTVECTTVAGSISSSSEVTMANGSQKPASELRVGESVLSYNPDTKEFVPSTIVTIKSVHPSNEYIINGVIYGDSNEIMVVNGKDTMLKDVHTGDKLFEPTLNRTVTVSSIVILNGSEVPQSYRVYDINTAPTDNYIIDGYLGS